MSKKKSTDIKLDNVDLSALTYEQIEIDLPELERKDPLIDEFEEELEEAQIYVELNEDTLAKGVECGSYYAGFLASLLQVGVPAELAVDVLINHETIEHNLKMKKSDDKESIIEKALNGM